MGLRVGRGVMVWCWAGEGQVLGQRNNRNNHGLGCLTVISRVSVVSPVPGSP